MNFRMLFPYCMLLGACHHVPSTGHPKTARQEVNVRNFDVVVFLSPYFNIDTHLIYEGLSTALRNIGSVSITKAPSLFESFTQLSEHRPICYFTLVEKQGCLEVSLNVLESKEHLKRGFIWRKEIVVELKEVSNNPSLSCILMMNTLIEEFKKEYLSSIPGSSSTFFHIAECSEIAPESNVPASFEHSVPREK